MEGARLINGVTFGSIYCEDLGLILSHRDLGNPKPKTSLVEVPGSSVTLDFTEAFGVVNYSNRKISLEFVGTDPWDDHFELEGNARDLLHGRKMQIRFDEDDSFYFIGRINIESWLYRNRGGKVKMSIDADPWRYKDRSQTLHGEGSSLTAQIVLKNNGLRSAVPTIHAEQAMTVIVGGDEIELTAGQEYTTANLALDPGDNTLEFSGADQQLATVTWTEVQL